MFVHFAKNTELCKKNMRHKIQNGREMYFNVTTEELIALLKRHPCYELEC